jgi:hypothetical protein
MEEQQAMVDPAALRQFGDSSKAFFLITDRHLASRFVLADSPYADCRIIGIGPDDPVGRLIDDLPDESAILIAAPGRFVRDEDLAGLGGRRVCIMPCGSTPVRSEHIAYFLTVMERTDPVAQAKRAESFFDAVAAAGTLRLIDDRQQTECGFAAGSAEYVWNQQAGVLEPGEQQIAPAGELSVLPMEIIDFDPARRLALDGSLTLRGEPIVHAGYDRRLDAEQAQLYRNLQPLNRHPVVLEVEHGLIVRCTAGGPTPESTLVATTLNRLFAADPRYRTVWELGFGINTAMNVVPANCGMNEVYGAENGVVHLGIGLTPFTRFALTFLCPATRLADRDGTTILGTAGRSAGDGQPARIKRIRESSCGCH